MVVEQPTVSIAMATYNGGKYLARQLESFAAQTRLPDELIICDDGSTDDTPAIVRAFAERAPFRVRFAINPERLGYNRNFAHAIGLCAGEIIFVSDQDDVWYADKIETMVAALAAAPEMLSATCDQVIADASGGGSGATVLGNIRKLGYSDDLFGPGCCTALRQPLLQLLTPFPGDAVPYDHWATIIPALLGARIICERPLQMYRRHGGNTSGSTFARDGASSWTLVAASGGDAGTAYRDRAAQNDFIVRHLVEKAAVIEHLGLGDRLPGALATLRREAEDYRARAACLDAPRIRRLPAVLRMLKEGRYDRFRGYKSALKDMVA